ncbi:MAG: Ig-like domain-containing protein, partial [Ferruginibacter sp.]|nr:Ig-like domain-containing protein [Ferruginibacter sp.]
MKYLIFFISVSLIFSCKKNTDTAPVTPPPPGVSENFNYGSTNINGLAILPFKNVNRNPAIKVKFSVPVSRASATQKISITENAGALVGSSISFENNDSTVSIIPQTSLQFLTRYKVKIDAG